MRNGLAAVFKAWIEAIEESGHSRPNQAELARRLSMSTKTLSDYLQRLRQILHAILPKNSDG